ncbi:MAG TPA: choice-of-anchor V domain-containing protein [Sunxiuqinia sp.]|nr:choice-of-anchor V domain-containing protein [Sunxiuqinia sp.]
MKSAILLLIVVTAGIIFTSEIMHSNGSPGGYTGSPLDSRNCTQCHYGTAASRDSLISSDIPESGYIPGQTYSVSVKLDDSNMNACGFELTSETHFDKVGKFENITDQNTQTLNSGRSITHTYLSNSPTNGSKTWKVDWVAPAQYTGQVHFYVACNAANGNASSTGDQIYLSNYTVEEGQLTGIDQQKAPPLSIYYNPGNRSIKILNIPNSKSKASAQVFSINGAPVKSVADVNQHATIDASDLNAGVYIITVIQNNHVFSQKVSVN